MLIIILQRVLETHAEAECKWPVKLGGLTLFRGLKLMEVIRTNDRRERRKVFFPARTGVVRCRTIQVNDFDEDITQSEPDEEAMVLVRVVHGWSRNTNIAIIDHDGASRYAGVDFVEQP